MGCVDNDYNSLNGKVGENFSRQSGVKIGKNSIVGAGSVVTKDIPEDEVWGGCPAECIMTIDEYMKKTMQQCHDYNIADSYQLKNYWLNNKMNKGGAVVFQKCDNYRYKVDERNRYGGK